MVVEYQVLSGTDVQDIGSRDDVGTIERLDEIRTERKELQVPGIEVPGRPRGSKTSFVLMLCARLEAADARD
jgi:hypothetical protein